MGNNKKKKSNKKNINKNSTNPKDLKVRLAVHFQIQWLSFFALKGSEMMFVVGIGE
jgi:hypothetical protein